ncbi:GAF and ANTAR domain-containing protein [Arthrobacter sp. D3-16]
MGTNLRVWKAHHQTGADGGGGGTAWFRKQSSAPTTTGPLLDFRAGSDQDSLDLLAFAAVAALPDSGAVLDCAVIFPRPGQAFLASGTSDRAVSLARQDYECGDGPVSHALSGESAVVIANSYTRHPHWPTYWEHLAEAGYRSLVSYPLALEPGRLSALTFVSDRDGVFTPATLAHLEEFAPLAASSFLMAAELRTARTTVDNLRSAMQGRTSIDVACGVIMGQNRCSYQEAFQILANASSHRNVKARVVAENILSALPGGPPTTHFKG